MKWHARARSLATRTVAVRTANVGHRVRECARLSAHYATKGSQCRTTSRFGQTKGTLTVPHSPPLRASVHSPLSGRCRSSSCDSSARKLAVAPRELLLLTFRLVLYFGSMMVAGVLLSHGLLAPKLLMPPLPPLPLLPPPPPSASSTAVAPSLVLGTVPVLALLPHRSLLWLQQQPLLTPLVPAKALASQLAATLLSRAAMLLLSTGASSPPPLATSLLQSPESL